MKEQEFLIKSSVDGTLQPSLFFKAGEGRPLLLGLHTWSYGRRNQIENMLPLCERNGFSLLLPEFRGPNLISNPQKRDACGSDKAIGDVLDALDYVIANEGVDAQNVFLLGLSGGGYMSLMTAARAPERFRAVGAYVPITDLYKYSLQNADYAPHVRACCGDDKEEMLKRSPVSYVDGIARANLKIFHGKFDPVVPVSHSLELFAAVHEKYPRSRVFLDIFDGGHEIDMKQAEYWLLSQYKETEKTAVTG
ncbi:MAG: prolyl oligopeptidase family serine peptidase [Clostridia bacterium]|nr:prolyl oligopeptidase family serine peptidase [Clostridia bacterium]